MNDERPNPDTKSYARLFIVLGALACALSVGAVFTFALGDWRLGVFGVLFAVCVPAVPLVIARWNWQRARRCQHCGKRAVRPSGVHPPDGVHHVGLWKCRVPLYWYLVQMRCAACGYLFHKRLSRPYFKAR